MSDNYDDDKGQEEKENKEEFSQLETEFLTVQKAAMLEIDEKLELASKALNEAIKLSEKHGIPFESNISFLPNTYTPKSFPKKFEGLEDFISDYCGIYVESPYTGWTHSDICY